MKKLTPKQYAVSLYETIKDLSEEELKGKMNNFLEVVKKRKNLRLLNKIFKSFVEIFEQREGIIKVEVTSSRELSHKVKTEIIDWLKQETNRIATLQEKIEPEILGGVIIKFEDTFLDASLTSQLKRLQNSLEK